MTGKRLKKLARIRLVFSVIAVLLAGLMLFSGIMCFKSENSGKRPEETAATETPLETTEVTVTTEPKPAETTPDETETVDTTPDETGTVEATSAETEPAETASAETESDETNPSGTESNGIDSTDPSESDGNDGMTQGQSWEGPITQEETEAIRRDGGLGGVGKGGKTDKGSFDAEITEESIAGNIALMSAAETKGNLNSDDDVQTEEKNDLTRNEDTQPTSEMSAVSGPRETTKEITEGLKQEEDKNLWGMLFWCSAALLTVDLIAILILSASINAEIKKNKQRKRHVPSLQEAKDQEPQRMTVGTVHQVGSRDYQQDSLGHTTVLDGKGILAVLADGMGGLSGGEKVSQQIVVKALTLGQQLRNGRTDGFLQNMLGQINEDVNQMLGPNGLYKSGSTMVAVLVHNREFHWISVGDSRIYLYRQGYVNQLNCDHDLLQNWMPEILEGRRSCEEALRNPEGRKLTSFIGMGQLKYVDASIYPIELEKGDRLVLMSDGVYSVINEERLAAILKQYTDANQAAAVIERFVREAQRPHQDNYTAIVLPF